MGEQIRKKARGRQPISRHPLFPATVALWFAALFGLGSLIIRPALMEAMVLAVGLDAIIPAAAPPLGATARMLLALAMAALGGVVGLVAAHRIPRTSYRSRRTADGEEGESVAENPLWSDLKTRRRAIAAEQETPQPEAETAPAALVPAIDVPPQVLDLASVDAEALEPADCAAPASPEPEAEPEIAEPAAIPEPEQVVAAPPPERPRAEIKPAPAPLFAAPLRAATGEGGFPLPSSTAAERIASAELSELSHVELLERLALSLERRRHAPAPIAAPAPVTASAPAIAPAQPAPETVAEAMPEPTPAPEPLSPEPFSPEPYRIAAPLAAAQGPLEQPGTAPAELPRFMSALVAPTGPDGRDADEDGDEDAVFLPRFLPAPAAMAQRQDLTPDEAHWPGATQANFEPDADEDGLVEDAYFADEDEPVDQLDDEAEEEDEQVLEEGYSSLLSLGRNAAPRQFIRIDEPEADPGMVEPAVIFPGQGQVATGRFDAPSVSAALHASGHGSPLAPALPSRRPFDAPGETAPAMTPTFASTRPQGPEETEKALRDALAALQRMSGAA